MKLIETQLEKRVDEAFTLAALELLPEEVKNHDLTTWLLTTLQSMRRSSLPETFSALSFEINWNAIVAKASRHAFYFNTHFYLSALFSLGRLWRVSELAADAAEKALEYGNLNQTVLSNIEAYSHVLEEMKIDPDDQRTILADSFREIIDFSRSQHLARVLSSKHLWLKWQDEVLELKALASACPDEFLWNTELERSLTTIPQAVHDLIRFSFVDKGTINALARGELEARISDVTEETQTQLPEIEHQAEKPSILIVDDDENVRDMIGEALMLTGYKTETASTGKEALEKLDSASHELVICDLQLPDLDGRDLLDHMTKKTPSSQVIIMTAHGTISNIVEALKHGATDFLVKPFTFGDLDKVVSEAAARLSTTAVGESALANEDDIVATSSSMRQILKLVERIAPTNSPVLISGESGTGKEAIARAIHRRSRRAGDSFVPINCAALPDALFESELFGHEKGAFSGATSRRLGAFELASGGTLFLDQIEYIPLGLQAKLLRLLQEYELKRLGGAQPIHVDVRVVAATDSDLPQLIKKGEFRSDLFYRLSDFHITVPPLREHRDDIPVLAEHFIKRFAYKYERLVTISPSALEELHNYDWPGNVRELRNMIERAVILSRGNEIGPNDLALPESSDTAAQVGDAFFGSANLTIEQLERKIIEDTLGRAGGNKTAAAAKLGISRTVLRNKIKKYDIEAGRLDSETA